MSDAVSAGLSCAIAFLAPIAAQAGTLNKITNPPSHTDGGGLSAALVAFGGKYYGTTAGGGTRQKWHRREF